MAARKRAAICGSILMGLGSFMACLGTGAAVIQSGNILLVISLALSIWGFAKWQP